VARPRCAQHPNSRVWFDGTHGAPGLKRQRFNCVQPNGSRHAFTLPLPADTNAGYETRPATRGRSALTSKQTAASLTIGG